MWRLRYRADAVAANETVSAAAAVGWVSAELIAPYPPGVPVLAPGELITSAAGTAALNTGGVAEVQALSCTGVGACTIGGDYDANGGAQAFVAIQKNGVWGAAQTFSQIETLNTGKNAQISALSCQSA